MHIEASARLDIAAPPQQLFDLTTDCRALPRFVRPSGPIPGVDRAEMLDNAAPAVGALRRVTLTDGTTVDEEIVALTRPSLHRYRWVQPPAPPFSLLVRSALATWSFQSLGAGDGTRLIWTYRFELSSPLALPAAYLLKLVFERWMRQSLAQVRALSVGAS